MSAPASLRRASAAADGALAPRARRRIFYGYWAFGLLLRLPIIALQRSLPAGVGRELLLLGLKTGWSVLIPALLLQRLLPGPSLAQRLGLTPRPGARRRPLLALALAVGWVALVYALATAQDGHPPRLALPAVAAALWSTAHVFVEELACRGLVLGWLAAGERFRRANLLTSALFVSMHVPGWYLAGLGAAMAPMAIVLFALSLLLGWLVPLSGTIWLGTLLHLANNALADG